MASLSTSVESTKRIICTVTTDISYDQRMQRICSALTEEGYDVCLIGRLLPTSVALDDFPFECKRIKCFFTKSFLFYIEFNLRLFLYLLFKRVDIINSVDMDTLSAGVLLKWFRRKPLVFDAHEYFSEMGMLQYRPKVKKIWALAESFLIPKCDYGITVSYGIADKKQEKFNRPFIVVRNVPFKKEYQMQSEVGHIWYQGALNKGRGLELLVRFMKQYDGKLTIAGDGPIKQQLEEFVLENNLSEKVHFLGWIKPSDLPKYQKTAWIGVNLLENKGFSYYHSLANKFFDYTQMRIPQIGMSFPEYTRLNSDYHVAELIDQLELKQLNEAVHKLHDESYYQRIQKNCEQAQKVWNWDVEKQKLVKLYQKI